MAASVSNRNLVAALAYLLWFVTGIVILLTEKEDKFIRFHAMQSTVVFGSLFVVNTIVGLVFEPIAVVGIVAKFVNTLVIIVFVIIWIISMIKAYRGQMFKWPVFGDFAEKQVGK